MTAKMQLKNYNEQQGKRKCKGVSIDKSRRRK